MALDDTPRLSQGFALLARRAGRVVFMGVVWLGALLCLAPFLYVLIESFISESEGRYHRPALLNYLSLLQSDRLWIAVKNTAVQEVIILATTLIFCPLAAYAFAKFTFRGKGFLFGMTMLTLFFAPITQLIPLLLEMNEISWVNTYQALVIPLAISSLGIFWMTIAIRAIPDELLLAARLDGCGSFAVWWRMVLPLIRPSLLALAFVTFLTAYNDYFWPLLVLPGDSMQTVQLYLQASSSGYQGSGGVSQVALVVTSLPTIVAFLIMQHFYMPALFRQHEGTNATSGDQDRFAPAAPPSRQAATAVAEETAPSGPLAALGMALAGLRPWPSPRWGRIVPYGLLAGCTSLVFLDSLSNKLRLDDVYRVVGNPGIERLMPFWRHFGDPSTSAFLPSAVQFRPLLPLSLSLNYALPGDSAAGYHLGNLLFSLASGLVIFVLARELLCHWAARQLAVYRCSFLALAVALVVTIHPVSGLLVSYVSGRSLLLMEAFLCASLLFYCRMRRLQFSTERSADEGRAASVRRLLRRWYGRSIIGWVLVLALFELALLAKAQAIVAPALILSFELTVGRGSFSRWATLLRPLPFALVGWWHFVYINSALHFTALPDAPSIPTDAVWTYPLTQTRLSILHYLPNFVWPFNVRAVAVEPTMNSLQDPGVLLGAGFIAVTLIAVKLLRRSDPLLAFCILGYWIAQSPESSVVPMLHNAVDYRPYPASPFLFLAVALLLERLRKPAVASMAWLALILFFAAASVYMNALW